ncbi:hypothetical protein Pint_22450 [Pistacia integerrima]|uniref:Uncharacterized protein n=1 Tax=Pistacia integerrima TaxID=434235 RepID=A0ACC0YNM9_9ROSI|nr:hypothetical protein Pint_22450 [Pistacia integerrima]
MRSENLNTPYSENLNVVGVGMRRIDGVLHWILIMTMIEIFDDDDELESWIGDVCLMIEMWIEERRGEFAIGCETTRDVFALKKWMLMIFLGERGWDRYRDRGSSIFISIY